MSFNSGNDSGNNNTFLSCSSGTGETSFGSCMSNLENSHGNSMEETQRLELTILEKQKNGSGDKEEEVLEEEDEEEEEDTRPFDMSLSAEALDALEESLKQQMAQLVEEDRKFNENFKSQKERLTEANNFVMQRNEELKRKIAEVEGETREVILERDQALSDLRNVEQAFSDVHRKYERAKVVLENLKVNEDHLMQRDEEFQLLIAARDEKLEAYKQEMGQSLERMFNDFQDKLAGLGSETSKLAAVQRRYEMRIEALESELLQKQKENAQLNSLADELIGRSAHGQ